MNRYMKRFLGALFAAVGLILSVGWLTPVHAQGDDAAARLDDFLSSLADQGIFSGAVLVADDGEIILSEGYGLANREWDNPNTPDTKFAIASVTKQFTAMAILILQERGLLDVHDPICQYVEDCPETWAEITIEQLLTHASGIVGEISPNPYEASSVREIMDRLRERPLGFEPGTSWEYSNAGYVVLGYIIQEVSGDSYQTFLRENIFEPLGLENTGVDRFSQIIGHRAEGYTSTTVRAPYLDMSNTFATGGLYSTVEDLFRWNRALYGGEVIAQETFDAMLDAAVPVPDNTFQYSYGLALDLLADHPAIFHAGQLPGFSSCLAHLTDVDMDIVVLENEEHDACGVVIGLISMYFDE